MSQGTQIKNETRHCLKTGRKYKITLVKYNCKCCNSCWLVIEEGRCIYGGPYSGYEEVK